MIGSSVSHYRILEKIGSGGMGVVYKARDTRLDRFVAIKVLPPETVADVDRKRRFMQEAKSASALNHPHIVTIYDIESTDNVCFIAMEYIKGRTLRQMIPPDGMIPGEALNYAVQIADALAALHSKGIVHRDLKPTNVMVGEGSVVKVLDFGLVKLTEWLTGGEECTPSTMELTADGVVVGTPAYMSPEQVEGRPVDARSDIFSFGILLYEMLTGRRPFQGGTKLAVASAILNKEPLPITSINSSTPSEIERTVARCLEKDPQRRFQNAADLKVTLEWLARDVESGRLRGFERTFHARSRKRRAPPALVLLSAILATAVAAIYYWLRPTPEATPSLERATSDLGLTTNPALSPDGKLLAYASDRSGEGNLDIWLQQLSGGQPIRRTHQPTDEVTPDFSPDGSSIVFTRTGSGIFLMPSLAGGERQVAVSGLDPHFSPDGTQIVYWVGDLNRPDSVGRVFSMPLGRGAPMQVAAEFADAKYPRWAPDGAHILFQSARSPEEDPEWWVVPVAGGSAINTGIADRLRKRGLSPIWGPGDWQGNWLAFSSNAGAERHIWAATISIPGFHLAGPVKQLTFGTGLEGDPSIASDGRVALAGWNYHNNLWRLPLTGGDSGPGGLERLSETGAFDTHPSISADGRRLAFLSRRSGCRQVWIHRLDKGGESVLTIGPGEKSAPAMSADGSQVAYSIVEDGKPSIYIVPTDSSQPGEVKRACEDCGIPSDWTREGGRILYTSGQPLRVHILDLASGTSVPILQHPSFSLDQAHVSPDNRWIAFVAQSGTDRARIFVAHLRNGAPASPNDWIAITDRSSWGDKPRWLGDDSLIYYSDRDDFGCIWRQRLRADTKQPVGPPSAVQHFHELRRSPRTLYRSDFEIATAPGVLILNLVEAFGNIWLTSLPQR